MTTRWAGSRPIRGALLALVAASLFVVGAPGTAKALTGPCTIPVGGTTCTIGREFPSVDLIITRDQPLLGVRVNNTSFTSSEDGRTCGAALTYRLFIRGALTYEASLLPSQNNYDGPGSSSGGDNVGRYPPGTYPYREVVEFRIGPDCPLNNLRQYIGSTSSTLRTYSGGQRGYHLNISGIDLLETGVGVRRYTGNDWDPSGGPIQIFWGRTRIKTFPAAASFRGNLPVGFPDNTCTPQLRARQGTVTRTIGAPVARRAEQVRFAEGAVSVRGGRDLHMGDVVCEGEVVKVDAGGAYVGEGLPAADYVGLRVVNRQTDVDVPGGIFAPTVVVGLSGGRTTTVTGRAIALNEFDPAAQAALNFQTIAPGSTPSLDIVGLARVEGSLRVDGAATIDNGVLFVAGGLTVRGRASRAGVLVAAGELRLEGPVLLRTEVDGVALASGRKILLLGDR